MVDVSKITLQDVPKSGTGRVLLVCTHCWLAIPVWRQNGTSWTMRARGEDLLRFLLEHTHDGPDVMTSWVGKESEDGTDDERTEGGSERAKGASSKGARTKGD